MPALPLFRTHFGLKCLLSLRLAVALRLVAALIASPHLHIEPFAHQVHKTLTLLPRARRAPHHVRAHACGRSCLRSSRASCARRSGGRGATCSPSPKCTTTGAPQSQFKPQTRLSHARRAVLRLQVHPRKRSSAGRPHPQALRRRLPHAHPVTMHTLLHALLDPSKVPPCRCRPCACASSSGAALSLHLTAFLQPFCTHFGALSAISTMSPHSTATLLLPHMLP